MWTRGRLHECVLHVICMRVTGYPFAIAHDIYVFVKYICARATSALRNSPIYRIIISINTEIYVVCNNNTNLARLGTLIARKFLFFCFCF